MGFFFFGGGGLIKFKICFGIPDIPDIYIFG